jgi:MFS family permease
MFSSKDLVLQEIRKHFHFMQGNVLILTIRQILGMFCRRMVLPYSSLFIKAIGGSSSQIGLINSIRPLAGLLMFPLSGYLTDRTGRVKLIALAGYLTGVTMLLYVFAPSWEWIALGALIQGFMVFQFPPTSAILADSLSPRNRGLGAATMNSLATGFSIFSPYIAGVIITVYSPNLGMRILYTLLMLSNFANAILATKYLEETSTHVKNETLPGLSAILRESYSGIPAMIRELPRQVKALGLVVLMTFMANAIASPFWVVYVVEVLGMPSVDWGFILFLESVLKTLLTIPGGMLVDRFGRTKNLFISLILTFVSLPALILAKGFQHVLLIRLVVAVSSALFVPASTALMADYVPPKTRGRVMAAIGRGSVLVGAAGGGTGGPGMGYLFTIPVMLGSILGGVLYDIDPTYPWLCILVTSLIQILTLILFIRDPSKDEVYH